ncbi:MAG: FtsX-like permease family protein [Chloroflexi bacterium]|uniref:FtsX-like permease family protein n=1 Tax=Candidatus Chlorohelix allophototropha TaxID=3003348 RepID=A0A8T7LUR0_9CHLR|nr:FtsX-like permease family protein [Chloroflexota bacterium]WJW67623.1 FtsX-like permease family protein [Chloroflexota bacterium L227-S17]
MQTLILYFKYAWRSIWRGGQRTFFAILCIAVGVGSIVALQSTGYSIQDAVAGDARANSQADVLVISREGSFSSQNLAKIDALKPTIIEDYTTSVNSTGITVYKADGNKSNEFGSNYPSFVVDPAKYPFYGIVELQSPKGKHLKDVLTEPNQIVVNEKMDNSIGAKVGDTIKALSNDNKIQTLTVVGILTTKSLTPATDTGQAGFTGYGYITMDTAKGLFNPETLLAQSVFIKTSNVKNVDVKARDTINALSPSFNAQTSTERNDQLKQASKGISDLLSYVGLLSLLIGSVGVVNTMLVVVGRRSTEIATLKALGMEVGQTVQVFMIESAILGFIGSVVGVILGELLTTVINKVAANFINSELSYQFYLQPVILGLIVGIVTAVVFGLLPAYSASKIPPAQVLRQKTNALPRISIWATLFIIGVMTLVMGLLAGVILDGQLILGLIIAFATLVSCTILVLIFSGILWIVGKIPLPLGLNYKMARRNLSRGRAKSATTMLVMLVGIFAMALVFILASSLKETIQVSLAKSFGYNAQISSTDDAQSNAIKQALDNKKVPGLQKYLLDERAVLQLVSAGGLTTDQLIAEKIKRDQASGNNNNNGSFGSFELANLAGLPQTDLLSLGTVKSGGQAYQNDDQMIISESVSDSYKLKVGDQMVYQDVNGKQYTLTITGIFVNKSFIVIFPIATTLNRIQTMPNHATDFNLTIENGRVDEALKYVQSTFPGVSASDLSFISNIINSIIDNITAFPVLLAFLSLIAGAILIANNVALAVLERRTEMGVMKSIGADSVRVLSIINWETAIVGFLGGLFGLGLAIMAGAIGVAQLGTKDDPGVLSISPLIILGMLVLAVGLALAATIASAWGAAQEKPMVVLRYE